MTITLDEMVLENTTSIRPVEATGLCEPGPSARTEYTVLRHVVTVWSLIAPRTGYNQVARAAVADFAGSLRHIKKGADLTWDELAGILGVTRRTVHNWLAGGRVSGINAARLAGLSRALADELGSIPPDAARSHLLAPDVDGTTPLSRISHELRALFPNERPVLSGFDLLRMPESSDEHLITGKMLKTGGRLSPAKQTAGSEKSSQ